MTIEYGPTLSISKEKRCYNCTNTKSISDFHKGASQCKDCAKVYAKEYREKNYTKVREVQKASYQKYQEKYKK